MLVREFLATNETVLMPQPSLTFSLSKTEDTDERKAFCYDCEDKRRIETGAVGDIKSRIAEVFRRLEHTLA